MNLTKLLEQARHDHPHHTLSTLPRTRLFHYWLNTPHISNLIPYPIGTSLTHSHLDTLLDAWIAWHNVTTKRQPQLPFLKEHLCSPTT